jgi:hypothetical protein
VQMIDPAAAPNPTQTGFGDRSSPLEVFVDTQAPPVYFGLPNVADDGLLASSDTGVGFNQPTLADRITSDTTPTFWGTAEADAVIRVYVDAPQPGFPNGNGLFDPAIDLQIAVTTAIPLDGTNQYPNGHWEAVSDVNLNAAPFPLDGLRTFFVTAEDVAGNVNPTAPQVAQQLQIFLDTQGPQVTNVQVNSAIDNPYNLFGLKPDNTAQGPTPLVNSLVISFQDLPPRVAQFLFVALKPEIAATPGIYQVKGDANGIIPILAINVTNDTPLAGFPATATVELVFRQPGPDGIFNTPDDIGKPLPDDRFTLTISDEIQDLAGNHLDGESNASEPHEIPTFPSGDGVPGGDFIARFTVDSRPEIGTWSAGSVYVDTNGNFTFDPTNLDYTNRDLVYSYAFTSDNMFAGNFSPIASETGADGFDKLAAYGRIGTQYRWAIDTNNDGVPDLIVNDPANINGIPVAGNFDHNATNGDEVGLFDGTAWHLDTNHDFKVDTTVTSPLRGYPIVGDFDGDGVVDLATYQVNPVNKFFFDMGNNGYGQVDATIDAVSQFGFIGVRTLPAAADMDKDGKTDVGLWVPDRSGATVDHIGEWYFLMSNSATATIGTVNTLDHQFSPTPLGHDIFARMGNEYALPIVGNFDPPIGPQPGPTISLVAVSLAKHKITWNAADSDGVASATLAVDGVIVPNVAGPFRAATGVNFSAILGSLTAGDHLYTITATDRGGNVSTSSDTFTVVTAAAAGPTIGQVVVSQAKGKISWNALDADGVASSTLQIDGTLVTNTSGPFTAASGVNFSGPLGPLSTGAHSYTITATDRLGNQSSTSDTFSISSQGPTVSQVTVSEARGRISWNAASPRGVASATLQIDGTLVVGVVGPFSAASGVNFSAALPALAVGAHSYKIIATDGAGNQSTTTASFSISNVSSGPAISQVGVSEARARISWNALSAHGVASSTVTIDGGAASSISGPFAVASGVNFSAPLGQLAAGVHAYTITATDSLGNVSTSSDSFTLTNPTATGPTISQVTVSQAKRKISWNAVDSAGVRNTALELDGISVTEIAGPFAAASGVNFSASLGSLGIGNHTYRITATDGSGNISSVTGTFVLTGASGAGQNALASVASLSALSNSAKVDWLYDLGGLLYSRPSSSDANDKSAAVDAVLAAYQ